MTPSWQVADAAQSFWDEAGLPDAVPRDLRRPIALTQPISIVFVSDLHVSRVQSWLEQQGRVVNIAVGDRPLRACLIAQSGAGIIFIDGGDQECEQRFSIAHEFAHFLLDYRAPREQAVARLGEEILEVLDGRRPARAEERVVALLTGVPARTHVHLLGREEEEAVAEAIDLAEARADALALELLAPWADVSQHVSENGGGADRDDIVRLLTERYGLPRGPARRYAAQLAPRGECTSPLLRHLRNVPRGTSSPMLDVTSPSPGGPR